MVLLYFPDFPDVNQIYVPNYVVPKSSLPANFIPNLSSFIPHLYPPPPSAFSLQPSAFCLLNFNHHFKHFAYGCRAIERQARRMDVLRRKHHKTALRHRKQIALGVIKNNVPLGIIVLFYGQALAKRRSPSAPPR